MRTIEAAELQEILRKHKLWTERAEGGERADLSSANLSWADLSSANLSWADLSSANLSYSNLRSANLSSADLRSIKEDFFARLQKAKSEVVGLYEAIRRGKIDGSCYEGACCCFVGTIANIRGERHDALSIDLKPESSSPTEIWFMPLKPGDDPEGNQIAKITSEWIEEFAKENSIVLPKFRLVSSVEFPAAFVEGEG